MKKKLICGILCVVIILAFIINFVPISGEFSLNDYASEIQQFPGNQSFGSVSSPVQALSIAKTVWKERYPDGTYGGPYRVYYDSINHAWMVHASIWFILPSGPYTILLETDGRVIAVWNEKF